MQEIGAQERHQALGELMEDKEERARKIWVLLFGYWPFFFSTQGLMYPKLALTPLSSQRQLPPRKCWNYRCIPGLLYVRLGMELLVLCMIGEHSTT